MFLSDKIYDCHKCFKMSGEVFMSRMIVCPLCGNKRCPKAQNHNFQCTRSNEPNQEGILEKDFKGELNESK